MTGDLTQPARDKRMLVVFSGPRAGSNLLVDILGQLPDVLALSEVFNPAGIYGLSLHPELEAELADRAGGPQVLARLFRMNPPEALALLDAAVPQDKAIVLKILPHQVHLAALRECLKTQALGALILTRRRLDQYASYLKARETGVWFGANTSALGPEGRAEQALAFAGMLDAWLADVARLCDGAGVARATVDYDRDLLPGTSDDRARHLSRHLTTLGFDVPAWEFPSASYFQRQDGTEDALDKFCNGLELGKALRGLDALDHLMSAYRPWPAPGSAPDDD
ncbi:hypothetical protein SSE37_06304 [Sagittula stellata E-37]|uniref:Sulfotransferase n=2 Tax=Sagittula stellata TaxID=52603 RepID=A3K676_SAGS3|nr:hypothetical protein SSE37_06304 [Sagittula stellata E-37]